MDDFALFLTEITNDLNYCKNNITDVDLIKLEEEEHNNNILIRIYRIYLHYKRIKYIENNKNIHTSDDDEYIISSDDDLPFEFSRDDDEQLLSTDDDLPFEFSRDNDERLLSTDDDISIQSLIKKYYMGQEITIGQPQDYKPYVHYIEGYNENINNSAVINPNINLNFNVLDLLKIIYYSP
jgi:hypothetical protein